MTVFVSEVPSPDFCFPLVTLPLTFLALPSYPIFRLEVFVELALVPPLSATTTPFLFDTANYPMTVLVFQLLFNALPVFPITLSAMSFITVFALTFQSVLAGTVFAKLAFVLPLFAF